MPAPAPVTETPATSESGPAGETSTTPITTEGRLRLPAALAQMGLASPTAPEFSSGEVRRTETRASTASSEVREAVTAEVAPVQTAFSLGPLQRTELSFTASGDASRTFATGSATSPAGAEDTTQASVQEPVAARPLQVGLAALSATAAWTVGRAGGLIASLLASAPAWRSVDLLPVLREQALPASPAKAPAAAADDRADGETQGETDATLSPTPPSATSAIGRTPSSSARAILLENDE